jgi:hypothetical protein
MNENYTLSMLYNGEVITVAIITNTGTVTTDSGTINTHSVVGARASVLGHLTINITATADSVVEHLLQDLAVSYFVQNGTDTFYSGFTSVFSKDVPGTTLAFTDGVHTFTNGDTLDVYTLADGDGYIMAGLQESQVPDEAIKMIGRLQKEVDAIVNTELFNTLTGLGFRYDR